MAAMTEAESSAAPASLFSRHRALLPILLALALVLPLWQVHVVDGRLALVDNDLTGRLVGTRAALHGEGLYSAGVLREIQIAYYGRPLRASDDADPQRFAYPAFLVLLLAPLAPLSWSTACLVFLLVVTPLLAASFCVCVRLVNPGFARSQIALTVFVVFCSWPVIWALRLVQPTLLVAVAVFLGCFFLDRQRPISAGVLLAFSVLKPPMVLPLLAWLLLWTVLRRGWNLIVSFALTFALLSVATETVAPGWFAAWRVDLRAYGPQTMLPLQFVLGHWAGLAATLLLLAWSAYLLWALRHAAPGSPEFVLAISLALSAAVSANLMKGAVVYDQVLIVPSCLTLFFARPATYYAHLGRRVSVALMALGYIAVPIAIAGESFFGPSDFWDTLPCRTMILPVVVTVALGLQTLEAVRGRYGERVPLPLAADPSH
jgi:Glycosyltransferase family 87